MSQTDVTADVAHCIVISSLVDGNHILGIHAVTYVSEVDLKGCVELSVHYGNPEGFCVLASHIPLSVRYITVIPG